MPAQRAASARPTASLRRTASTPQVGDRYQLHAACTACIACVERERPEFAGTQPDYGGRRAPHDAVSAFAMDWAGATGQLCNQHRSRA